jgi:hypothetical protein
MNGKIQGIIYPKLLNITSVTLKGAKIISDRSNVSRQVEKVMFSWVDPSDRPSNNPNFTGSLFIVILLVKLEKYRFALLAKSR